MNIHEYQAKDILRRYGVPIIPDEQVTVCCGSTEAMMATVMKRRRRIIGMLLKRK